METDNTKLNLKTFQLQIKLNDMCFLAKDSLTYVAQEAKRSLKIMKYLTKTQTEPIGTLKATGYSLSQIDVLLECLTTAKKVISQKKENIEKEANELDSFFPVELMEQIDLGDLENEQ